MIVALVDAFPMMMLPMLAVPLSTSRSRGGMLVEAVPKSIVPTLSVPPWRRNYRSGVIAPEAAAALMFILVSVLVPVPERV